MHHWLQACPGGYENSRCTALPGGTPETSLCWPGGSPALPSLMDSGEGTAGGRWLGSEDGPALGVRCALSPNDLAQLDCVETSSPHHEAHPVHFAGGQDVPEAQGRGREDQHRKVQSGQRDTQAATPRPGGQARSTFPCRGVSCTVASSWSRFLLRGRTLLWALHSLST